MVAKKNGAITAPKKMSRTWPREARITVLALENPCKKGTGHFDWFKLYRGKVGTTVGRYLDNGGNPIYLKKDLEAGHIAIALPQVKSKAA